MSSADLSGGLYEIQDSATHLYLSILHDTPNAAVVFVPRGTAHAAQLWEVQQTATQHTTLRSVAHGTYVSFHGALPGHPLLATAAPREWTAERRPGAIGLYEEYTLKVMESPDAVPAPAPDIAPAAGEAAPASASADDAARERDEPAVEWVFASAWKLQIYPIPAVLVKARQEPQAWTFRRILLASEARRA